MRTAACILAVSIYGFLLAGSSTAGRTQAVLADPDDVHWGTAAATLGGGVNGPVYALAVYDGKLIVAGDFTAAGGTPANRIAAWDGTSWSPLGAGLYSLATPSLTVYHGHLIAAAGTGVFSWDGTSWSAIGAVPDTAILGAGWYWTQVAGLAVKGDTLLAAWNAGRSSELLPRSEAMILYWNDSVWGYYSYGCGYGVNNGLVVYQDQLTVCCEHGWDYGDCGGVSKEGPAIVWNDKLVMAHLYATSGIMGLCTETARIWLTTADGLGLDTILAYDLYAGSEHLVRRFDALGTYDGKLILGGSLDSSTVAAWNGTTWFRLGSGVGPDYAVVRALVEYDHKLIVGGDFTTAGGKSSPYIAMWTKRASWCPGMLTGDVNLSGTMSSADIIYLVNFIFKSQDPPLPCVAVGDANCSGSITAGDIICLVNYVFKGGAAPCDVCTLIPGTWECQ